MQDKKLKNLARLLIFGMQWNVFPTRGNAIHSQTDRLSL